MSQEFIRKIEDFTCEHCGTEVAGNGYTNHCPKCLWSKHVDIVPGDRDADCGGLMRPEIVEMEKGEFMITHKCEKCGYQKKNRASIEDDIGGYLAGVLR